MLKFIIRCMLCLGSALAASLWGQGFSFDHLSNRFIAPYGKNAPALFFFNNSSCSQVTGKIYDIHGKFVAYTTPVPGASLDACYEQEWDGRGGNGQTMSSGVYIFVFSSEGSSYSGVVVIVR